MNVAFSGTTLACGHYIEVLAYDFRFKHVLNVIHFSFDEFHVSFSIYLGKEGMTRIMDKSFNPRLRSEL